MTNKYETSPELKKFMYGSVTAFMLANVIIICLKFKYPLNYNYHIWSPFLFSSIYSLGAGNWIYRRKTPNLPHFWVGVITYSFIAGAISGMFYFLN